MNHSQKNPTHTVPQQEIHKPCVLIAEDDDQMRRMLVKVLENDGYETISCSNGNDLFKHLEPLLLDLQLLPFKAIVADINMPGLTGLEVLEDLNDTTGFPPMILITAFGDANIHARAEMAGVTALLDKPFDIENLLDKLHEILPIPS